ncbi:hypothetical protein KJ855_00255, partial [Patescibacteria group bacterium]|nr:hypothetical protein [Patescibacteria group bacterium]
LLVGAAVYSFIHFLIYQPIFFYILAHEFTHAVFAVIAGAQVKKIKVSSQGGWVELTQSNFVIDLAPYFFPLYSFVIAVIYLLLNFYYDLEDYYFLFFFLLGASLAFHYLSNWETLKIEQPDMKLTGKIFGVIFISILNLIFLNIILMFAFLDYVNLETIWQNYFETYEMFF